MDDQTKAVGWWWAEPRTGEERAAVWKLAYAHGVGGVDSCLEGRWCLLGKIKRSVLRSEEGNFDCWRVEWRTCQSPLWLGSCLMLMMVLVIGLGQQIKKLVSWSGQRNVGIVARVASVSMEEEETRARECEA